MICDHQRHSICHHDRRLRFLDAAVEDGDGVVYGLVRLEVLEGRVATCSGERQEALDELSAKNPEFETIATERRAYKDRLLQYAKSNGLVGEEGLVRIKELNKYHVPFYRVMEESTVKFLGKTKLAGNIGSPIKRIKGSEREIIDPFESDVKDTYAIMSLSEQLGIHYNFLKGLIEDNERLNRETS